MKAIPLFLGLVLLSGCHWPTIVSIRLNNVSVECESLYIRIPLQTRLLEYSLVGQGHGYTEYAGHEDGAGTNITMTYGCKGAMPTEFTVTRNNPGLERTSWDIEVEPGSVTPIVRFGGDTQTGP